MIKNKTVGEVIMEQLDLYEMSTIELAVRTHLTRRELDLLLDSELYITSDLSEKLAFIFDTPNYFWLTFNQAEDKVIHMECV